MKCRNIGKNLGLFFLTAGALLGLLVLSALIPRSAIRDRMRASAAYLCSGEQFPMELRGVQASRIDRYADSILMGIAWQYDREHPLSSVLLSSYYDSEEKSVSGSLLEAVEEDRAANQQYFRYWHGSIALVRPLLTVLSLRGIYIFNGAALAALWGGLLTAILRRRAYVPAAGALAGLAAVSVWFVPLCMEYVWVFLTAAAAGLAVVRQAEPPAPPGKARKPFRDGEARDASDAGVAGLFLVVGTVTNFLDFLTSETLTLTLPLLLLLWFRRREENSPLKTAVRLSAVWGAGYAGMWALKWSLAAAVLEGDAFSSVAESIRVRLNGTVVGTEPLKLTTGAVTRNLAALFPWGYGSLGKLAALGLLVAAAYAAYVYRRPGWRKDRLAAYALAGGIPFLRYLILRNHSYIHSFFTCRALLAAVLAAVLILGELTEGRGHGRSYA